MMMPGCRMQFLFCFCGLFLRRNNAVAHGTDISCVGERGLLPWVAEFQKISVPFLFGATFGQNHHQQQQERLWKCHYFQSAGLDHEMVRILTRSRGCHICTSSGVETDLVSSSFYSRFPLVHCIPLTRGVSWISVARDTFRQIKPACCSLIFHLRGGLDQNPLAKSNVLF